MRNREEILSLENYLARRYTKETVASYQYIINKYLEEHPNARRYRYAQIETYFKQLKIEGNSVSYRRTTLAGIKAYYSFLLHHDYIEYHPCRSFFISEKTPTGMNFSILFTRQELEVMLTIREERYQDLRNRNLAIIGLLIYQGITSAELVNLSINDIDLEGSVYVRGTKRIGKRNLELKPNQIIPLQYYIDVERPKLLKSNTNKLFLTKLGVPLTVDGVHAFITSMQGAFDKKLTPLNIRNSVISYWLNNMEIPLEHVQIMAGHKYPSSTEKYVRKDIKKQREVLTNLHEDIFK